MANDIATELDGTKTWAVVGVVLALTLVCWGLSVLYFQHFSPEIEPSYAPMQVGGSVQNTLTGSPLSGKRLTNF